MNGIIRHTINDLCIDPSDPFKNDTLGRKEFANLLTSLVSHYSNGFVMAINGSWGTGKSVFMQQWLLHLKANGYKATLFNAWDNDYFEEPTIAILSQFTDFFEEDQVSNNKIMKAWELLQKVPRYVIKGFIEKQASEFISEESIQEIKKEYTKLKETGIDYKESDIAKYLLERIEYIKYQNSLTQFAAEVSHDNKPLVFIIDELDRCKPTYAIEILEKIKHLFCIPNIIFVISIDKDQLKNSIEGFYGSFRFNSEEYLRRFFDIDLDLPAINYIEFSSLMAKHFELKNYFNKEEELLEFIKITSISAQQKRLTLRQLEKFFSYSKVVLSSYNIGDSGWIISILLLIYKFDNGLYNNIQNKYQKLWQYASDIKQYFDFSECGKGPNQLGIFLYYLNCYLQNKDRLRVEDKFKFDNHFNSDFNEKELENMAFCYEAASKTHNYDLELKKLMSRITLVNASLSK